MICVCICSINSFTLSTLTLLCIREAEKINETTHNYYYYANIFQKSECSVSAIAVHMQKQKNMSCYVPHMQQQKKMELQARLTEMGKAQFE